MERDDAELLLKTFNVTETCVVLALSCGCFDRYVAGTGVEFGIIMVRGPPERIQRKHYEYK